MARDDCRRDEVLPDAEVHPEREVPLRAREHPGALHVEDQSTFPKKNADTWGVKLSADGTSYVGPNLLGRLLMELRDNGTLEYTLPEDATHFDDLKEI